MSAEEYRRLHPRFKDERQFEMWVIKVLKANGWLVSSMKDSRKQMWGTDRGIPDIVAVHPEKGIIFAELKMPKKKPTPAQGRWLYRLLEVANLIGELDKRLIVDTWWPDDEDAIIRIAGGKVPL